MKQAKKEVEDIRRMKIALTKTSSPCLIRDYNKAIARKTKELKEYCKYRGIAFEDLGVM